MGGNDNKREKQNLGLASTQRKAGERTFSFLRHARNSTEKPTTMGERDLSIDVVVAMWK